ncbi:unnamed protein product [Danaus chrysippus]|uniref:(African queen) hypothetical protein n=1 Tax=Danaus chrysippus TaxID=151541 RepID=A0A8J2Q7W5_9NEOP|nr:unnamed protein product [Danaus chrysippus]
MTLLIFVLLLSVPSISCGSGLLFLYQPKDITSECAFSRHLRFDISFGMGMSDTITLIFRTLKDIEYECLVEVVTSGQQFMLVVVRYPNALTANCEVNRDAFTVLKRRRCIRLCDLLYRDVYANYFIFSVKDRIRFLFKSNSSINTDINANFYQVTITSARKSPAAGCNKRNETICTVEDDNFCFTTGVVCDGIKNCGVDDWFDERKALCSLPIDRLGYAPVIAVMAAMICGIVAGGHVLLRCLPSYEKSYFIFNENEDNRLCIDPLLIPHGIAVDIECVKRSSIIPVSSSSTQNDSATNDVIIKSSEGPDKTHGKGIIFEKDTSSQSPPV